MRGPTSSAAAAGAAGGGGGGGGDNSQTVLPRLVSDMQLLQSKLHLFNTTSPAVDQNIRPVSGHGTGTVLPSDDMDTKIDELKQRYDAEVVSHTVVYYT